MNTRKSTSKFFISFLFLAYFACFSAKQSLIKEKITKFQENEKDLLTLKPDGSIVFNAELCKDISNLDAIANSIKNSITDLLTTFKFQVKKFIQEKKTNNVVDKKTVEVQMKIISVYLDEVHKITQLLKQLKVNFKDYKKNGCEISKEDIKPVYLCDKLLSKLVNIIRKHVHRIESPFKSEIERKQAKSLKGTQKQSK